MRQLSGTYIRKRRVRLGLTQLELGRALEVTANTVARWERGEQRVSNPERVDAALQTLGRALAGPRHGTIARGTVPEQTGASVTPSSVLPRHNLPAQLTGLVGRERDVTEVHHLLQNNRLVTLTGAGGIGKTRLAVQVAREHFADFADGAWFVDLAQIRDDGLVAQAVAVVLRVPERPGKSLVESLVDAIQGRRQLLILDNCEHVLDPAARLIDRLLRTSDDLRVLTTSREALSTAGERVWRVKPLPVPEAPTTVSPARLLKYESVRLFVDRATAAESDFALTVHNGAAVVEVCRRLDGIPLAIELAAACVTFLSPVQLLSLPRASSHPGAAGQRGVPIRHQTMTSAIEWSYQRLLDAERNLFTQLSVFVGGFSLGAAESVSSGPGVSAADVAGLLGRLVAKSLILAESGQEGAMRYRLLEPMRDFAQERLELCGESDAVHRKHAAFCLEVARQADQVASGAPLAGADKLLAREQHNMYSALRWFIAQGETESAQTVGVAVAEAWRLRGHFGQGRALLTELADLPGAGQATLARANLCFLGALLGYLQGDLSACRRHAEQCVVISRALGHGFGVARGLGRIAHDARAQGNFQEARACLQEGLEACVGPEHEGVAAGLSVHLALVARDENNYDEAGLLARTALDVAIARGFTRVAAHALLILGDAAAHRGETAEARRYLDKSVALWTKANDRWGQARAMLELGRVAIDSGEHTAAASVIAASLRIYGELADAWGRALALETSAALAARSAQPALALQFAEAAAQLRLKADLVRSPRDSGWLAERLRLAERALGSTRCTLARAKGRELTMEDAIELALRVDGVGRPAALTRRERDVAGLVALGWTDSRIALELVVGRRTVESHMSTIRSKLGFNSRAQVAVWAVEQGLRVAVAPAGASQP